MRPTSFWVDGAKDHVSATLAQINRYKEQFVSNKFQTLVITLYEEQCGIVLISTEKKFEFVTTSDCTIEKLRERYCNTDVCTHLVSVHCTRFAVRNLRRERESSMSKNKAGSRRCANRSSEERE